MPLPALRVLWDLEARGFSVWQDGDRLMVKPDNRLTPVDCAQVTRWKWHLLALVGHDAPRLS